MMTRFVILFVFSVGQIAFGQSNYVACERSEVELEYLKIREAAALLQVSPTRVTELIRTKRLHAVNVGDRGKRPQWRIPRTELSNIQSPYPQKQKQRRGEVYTYKTH